METILISFDSGRFVVVRPRSTLSLRLHVAAQPQNVEVENTVKFGVFASQGRRSELISVKFSVKKYITQAIFGHEFKIWSCLQLFALQRRQCIPIRLNLSWKSTLQVDDGGWCTRFHHDRWRRLGVAMLPVCSELVMLTISSNCFVRFLHLIRETWIHWRVGQLSLASLPGR